MNLTRALRLVASSALVVAAGLLPLASRAVTVDPDAVIGATRLGQVTEMVPLEDANALASVARSEDVLWHRLVVLGADGSVMPDVIETLRTLRDSGAHSRDTTVMALEPLHLRGYEGEKAVDLALAFLEKRPVAWEFVDVDGERRAQAEWLMAKGMDPDEAAWRVDNDPRRVIGAAGEPPNETTDDMSEILAAGSGDVAFEGEIGAGLKDPVFAPNAICRNCPQYDGSLTPSSIYRTVAGSLGTGDCKTYRMTVVGGRAYRATFCEGGGSAAFDTILEVKNGNCSVIAGNDDFCAGGKSQVDFSASANGYVYIKVSSQSGAGGSFVMAYRETGAAQQGCTSCPNFDYGVFAPTSSWQNHSSTLAPGSCRMYKFALRPSRSYVFTFCQGGGTADFDTRIESFFNNCRSGPFNEDACAGGLSEIIVNSNTSQYFYVRVSGAVVGTGNYTLAYRETISTCKTCPDYDFGAFTPTNSEQLHAAGMLANGCRIYAFYLSAGIPYRFSLCTNPAPIIAPGTNGSATFDSTLEFFDAGCVLTAPVITEACGDDDAIYLNAPATGIHYVKVGTTGASGSYVLSYMALFGAGGTCNTCPTFPDATLPPPALIYTMYPDSLALPGDCRIYDVALTAGLLYEFKLCLPEGDAAFDSTLKIQDPLCANVGTINNNACGDDALGTVIPAADGNYFVTVGGAVGASGPYVLAYREVPAQCTACPSSDALLPVPTPAYQTMPGSLAQQSDCTTYAVALTAGETYEFTFCAGGGSAAFDSGIALVDNLCILTAFNADTCGDDAALTYLATATTTHYVTVASTLGQGNFVLAYREIPIVCPTCPSFTADVPAPTLSYQNAFGSIDVAGDCRIYRVPLVANTQYEFTFCAGGGSAPTLDTTLESRDAGCFGIGAASNDFCGDDAQQIFVASTTGNYYIRVADAGTGTGAFALAYRQLPPPCLLCPFVNVNVAAATPAYQTVSSSLTIAGECYVIGVPTPTVGATYEFTFCAGGGSAAFDSVLALTSFPPGCDPVGSVTSDACGDDDSAVVAVSTTPFVEVKISANGGGVGPFTLAYREVPVVCPVCPATSGALAAPTSAYQIQSGSLDAAGDCRIYSVPVLAGKGYEFTFCAPGSAATFDSTLQLMDDLCVDTGTTVVDACGDDDTATVLVTADATYHVRVAANAGGIGAFDLAYREIPVTCPTCPAFDQVIPAPTPAFTTASDSLDVPGDCRIFKVSLTAGSTYEFTFCDGGGTSPFDSTLQSLDPACAPLAFNDDTCILDADLIFVAPTTGDHFVRIGSFAGLEAGAFTVAYRVLPVTCLACPASDATLLPPTAACQTQVGSLAAGGDCRIYAVELVAGTAYEFSFCPIVPPPNSDCCVPNGGLGCDDGGCEAAVCAVDSFCCNVEWDALCVNEAVVLCPTCAGSCLPFATFDSVLALSDGCTPAGTSIDDNCGDDARATIVAATTGTHHVTVSANAGGIGDFELGYRELAPTCTTCPAMDGALAAPTNAYQTQAGVLTIPGDCNTFRADLTAGKTYEFTFCAGGGAAAFNAALELTDGACAPVGAPNNAACGDDARVQYQATASQPHFIRVYAEDGSTGTYTLAYREVPAQCTACPAFDASLNAPRLAYQTVSGSFVTGSDCRTYRVGLTVGRTYEFTFCAGGGSATFNSALALLNGTCAPVGSVDNDECGDDARGLVVAPTTSLHRVTVSSQDGSIGNYTLAYREVPTTCKVCPAFDGTLAAPTVGFQTISGSLDAGGDCRIYKIPLTASACQNTEFTFCGGGGSAAFDSVIAIRNAACVPAGTSIDNACGDDASATLLPTATGDYFVRVSANAGGVGDFTLAWRLADLPCTACPASDATLPDPTPAYQTASGTLVPGSGCVLYDVPLVSGLTYEFTFCDGGGSASFDSVLGIQDAACGAVGSSNDDACGDDADATVTAAATENHYVRVSGNGCGAFTLAYRQILPTCNACPLFNEGLAAPTPGFQTFTDSLDAAGDCRIYVVSLAACENYEFTFCDGGGSADFDSVITLFSSACGLDGLSVDDACGDDAAATLTVDSVGAGDRYVRVSANGNGTGNFTLAYRSVPGACKTCPDSDAALPAPTTSVQTVGGSLTAAGDCVVYSVALTAGLDYSFSLCAADGGSGSFESLVEVSDSACTPVGSSLFCGDDGKAIITPGSSDTFYVRVSSPACSAGAFTLAYLQLP